MKRTPMMLAACFTALTAHAGDLKPLRAAEVEAVLSASQGKPQIVEIWSLDCSYCRENTARVAEWQKKHRDVRLTMIAMDPIDDNAAALSQVLASLPLPPQTALYANVEAMPEKLRRALDANWHGEMPRTLLIDGHGARQASSGLLQPAALDAWHR
ncbi:TlpA family protein disulfide reductase [Paraburkholderia azotifigens]|uniref:TlpA family protein disulfide reductase n=1 Tax=Paraburkholderia azotifigens TaxID=2057004 RepID=A0A5C6VVY4_9BURK|nr:TlpA family protein disulfide reductase [Paraburkholderia azotifigens]TXC89140.1 TlpA family protein disulfide reductase [Paraburkholderia azotifigens]